MIGQSRRPGADTAVAFEPETTGYADRSLCAAIAAAKIWRATAPNAAMRADRNQRQSLSVIGTASRGVAFRRLGAADNGTGDANDQAQMT
jgi:hypothetical protein